MSSSPWHIKVQTNYLFVFISKKNYGQNDPKKQFERILLFLNLKIRKFLAEINHNRLFFQMTVNFSNGHYRFFFANCVS